MKKNIYLINPNTGIAKMIINSKWGLFEILIDADMIEIVNKYCWRVNKNSKQNRFDVTAELCINGKKTTMLLSRYLLNLHLIKCDNSTLALTANHIDRNPLNNCLSNLERKPHTENTQLNSRLHLGRFIMQNGEDSFLVQIRRQNKVFRSPNWRGDKYNAAISAATAQWRDSFSSKEFKSLEESEIKNKINAIIAEITSTKNPV